MMGLHRRCSSRSSAVPATRIIQFLLLLVLFLSTAVAQESSLTPSMKLAAFRYLEFPDRAADQLNLHVSLWFPTKNDANLLNVETLLQEDHPVRAGVLRALEQVLCRGQTDLVITEQTDAIDGTTLQNYNVCRSWWTTDATGSTANAPSNGRRQQRTRSLQNGNSNNGAPSVLHRTPQVSITKNQSDDGAFTWSVWSVQYRVLQVGDVFVQEALMNNPDLLISELQDAAISAMRLVVQLTLDVHIMEGALDESLEEFLPSVAYSAVVEQEYDRWVAAEADFAERYSFQPRKWYTMRIAGLILLVLSASSLLLLQCCAKRRRRRRLLNNSNNGAGGIKSKNHHQHPLLMVEVENDDQSSTVQLANPDGVDKMLDRSNTNIVASAADGGGQPPEDALSPPTTATGKIAMSILEDGMSPAPDETKKATPSSPSSKSIPYGNDEKDNADNADNMSATNVDYEDYDWKELPAKVQQAATVLGYTPKLWDKGKSAPCEDKYWRKLTPQEKQAAAVLGYNKLKWDAS